MKKIIILLMLLLMAQILFAQEASEKASEKPSEKPPEEPQEKKNKVSSSSELFLQAAYPPGLKVGFTKRFKFPFLQGDGPMTEDNNIGLALTGELSPISLNGIAEAVWTPIAFFQFMAGGRIGSGWNINLFGKEVRGIGIFSPDADGKAVHTGKAFDGLLWKAYTGAVLQADLAAIIPGDWNHVVARTYHEINYRGYTTAAKGDSWSYEDDHGLQGENCNGFNYYGNLLLGYQMPIFLNMTALLTEANLYLYDTPGREKWGDDLVRWTFSFILRFSLTKKIDLALTTQFWAQRNYLEADWQDLYYRNRTLDKSNPVRMRFYQVAAIFSLKLK